MLCAHKVTWGKAFLRFSAVFEWIINIVRTEVTSPFFDMKQIKRYAKYHFVTSVRSYLKSTFQFFVTLKLLRN